MFNKYKRSGQYLLGKHVVFYQLSVEGGIIICRILHEKMDYDNHL